MQRAKAHDEQDKIDAFNLHKTKKQLSQGLQALSHNVKIVKFKKDPENKKIIELAYIVKKNVENFFGYDNIEIEIKNETVDNRSYHVNSDKIKKLLGFSPEYNIDDAVISLCDAFKNNKLPNSLTDPKYINVTTLKESNAL
jgi:hypothetical protein